MRRTIRRDLPLMFGLATLLVAAAAHADPLPEQHFNMGYDALQAGNYDLAIDYFKRCVEAQPDHKKAWYNLGHCYSNKAMYAEEVAAYEKALAIDPDYTKALTAMMYARHDLGEYRAVVQVAERLKSLDPTGFDGWLYLGHAYFKVAQNQASVDGKNGVLRRSIEASSRCIEQTADQKMCWYNLALAHEQLGELDAAVNGYRKAIELDPDYVKALYALAYMYELRGDRAAEFATWLHYIPLASPDPQWTEHVAYGESRVAVLEPAATP
jgi:tetratricopeptide (TPR) repeat protein